MRGHVPEPLRQGRVAAALHRADAGRAGRGRASAGSTCSARASPPTASRRSRRSTRRRGPPSWPPAARSSATSPASTTSTSGIAALAAIALRHMAGWTTPGARARRTRAARSSAPSARSGPDSRLRGATGASLAGLGPMRIRFQGRRAARQVAVGGALLQDALAAGEEIGRAGSRQRPAAKPSREVRPGDTLDLAPGHRTAHRRRRAASAMSRGPAPVGAGALRGDAESVAAARGGAAGAPPDARAGRRIEHGRPTKRDRRQLADWNRWSASVDRD